MPLKIRVKPESKIVAGGAVLKNVGKHSAELLILSDSPVLREDFMLGFDRQNESDAANVYFILQMIYLFKGKEKPIDELIINTVRKFGEIYPAIMDKVEMIIAHLEKGESFKALRLCHGLLESQSHNKPGAKPLAATSSVSQTEVRGV